MRSLFRRLTLALVFLVVGAATLRLIAIGSQLPRLVHDTLVYMPTLVYVVLGLGPILLVLRQRWAARSLCLASLTVLALNLASDIHVSLRSPRPDPADLQVRLLSFNIFQGRWTGEDLLTMVREQQPEILFLQEVPKEFFETHEAAIREMFPHVLYHNDLLLATTLNTVEMRRIELTKRRSMLHAVVEVEGTRLDVFNTHLSVARITNFLPRLHVQQRQVDEVLTHLDGVSGPFIIAGDFNVPLHSTAFKRFTARFHDARTVAGETGLGYTFNTCLPMTTIDHCFGRGVQFLSRQALPVWLSDHRPIRIEFAVPRS